MKTRFKTIQSCQCSMALLAWIILKSKQTRSDLTIQDTGDNIDVVMFVWSKEVGQDPVKATTGCAATTFNPVPILFTVS